MAQDPQTHALYRFYGAGGTLLYIGITNHLPRRLGQHHDEKAWWHGVSEVKVEHYPSREAVLEAERRAIIAEKPLYNDKHNQAGRWPTGTAPAAPSSQLTPICMGCELPIPAGDGTLHIVMAEVQKVQRAELESAERNSGRAEDIWEFIERGPHPARWLVHCDDCNPHATWSEDGYDPCSGCYSIGLDRCRTWAQLAYWTWHLSGKTWFASTNWNGMLGAIAQADTGAPFVADRQATR